MSLAGLWERWRSPAGEIVHSYAMLTINADDHPLTRDFHRPDSEKTFDAHVGSREEYDAWVAEVRESAESLNFPEEYYALAAPSENNEIQYFSEVSPSLYESIIKSFQAGGGHGESAEARGEPMSAEAAE